MAETAQPSSTQPSDAQPWPYDMLGDGDGQPWLWLHGWGMNRQALAKIAGQFAGDASHILYDQPGFGTAPLLAEGAGTADYADALLAQPTYREPTIVVGHSFGARVAVRAALAAPDKVKALILIAGAGPKRPRSPGWKIRAFALRQIGTLAGITDRLFGSDYKDRYRARFGSADYKKAGALRATFVATISEDLGPLAAKVACPVLLIYGDQDAEAPPILGEIYARHMPKAQLHILAGYDHWDILTRGAYQCEALIRAFLGK